MSLRIRVLDVNDNPPELATPYEAAVCEDAKPGQVSRAGRALSTPPNSHPFGTGPKKSVEGPRGWEGRETG